MKMIKTIKCEYLEWEFKCPESWEKLEVTDCKDIRYCNTCKSKVYYSDDESDINNWTNEGKCIAFSLPNPRSGEILLGRIKLPFSTESEKKEAIAFKIKNIRNRINKYGESNELLLRLSNLYDLLGDLRQAEKIRAKLPN